MNERVKKGHNRNLGWTRKPRWVQIHDNERCFQEVKGKGNVRDLGLCRKTTGKSDHNIAREAVQVKDGKARWPCYSGQLVIFSGSWTMAMKQAIMFNIAHPGRETSSIPFWCEWGFHYLLKTRPSSLFMLLGCNWISTASLMFQS